jgi:SpoVK/Ycf46/Vps4 family AAA+-type ATPase
MDSKPSSPSSRSSTPPPGVAEHAAAAAAEPDKTANFYKILTENAYQYYCKAMYYYKENEIEGSLINFLLALNNLYNVKTLFGSHEYQTLFKEAKQASLEEKKADPKLLITSNFQSCQHELADMEQNIDDAIDKVLSYVKTLQEQLKRIKNDRGTGSGSNKEDDNVNCKDVKQDFISGNALTFDDISGQGVAKDQIRSGILYPLIHPRLYPNSAKGILFYGPPGTGKTLLAKAFVNQLQKEIINSKMDIRIIFYAPTGAELKGKYVGETEKKITNYFRCAAKAATGCTKGLIDQNKSERPDKLQSKVISVLFLDEIEAIAGNRDKDESGLMTNSVNALLQMMDGVGSNENVIVMGATNYPWKLDEAVLRRFDTKIYIKLPTAEDIEQQIKTEIATNYIMKALTKPKDIFPKIKTEEDKMKERDKEKNKDKCTEATEKEIKDEAPKSVKLSCDDGKVCLTPYTGDVATLHPVKVFDFYRKLYFPEFTDEQIRLFSKNLAKNHYSGGDVKNICRYVYKLMGNRAKKIGKFEIETGILDPKKLTKSDEAELEKIKTRNEIESNEFLRTKIIRNACFESNGDYRPFEFKTFHTGGSIDMRHYSYSEEPSFLILDQENVSGRTPQQKTTQQSALSVLMEKETSVFISELKSNYDTIKTNNGVCFIKLDVIPDNIDKLIDTYLLYHPVESLKQELDRQQASLGDDSKEDIEKKKINKQIIKDLKLDKSPIPTLEYKQCIKIYIISLYKAIDQTLQACKNNSQKAFYVNFDNIMNGTAASPINLFSSSINKPIDIIIHQQLIIHKKLSTIPFKRDYWVYITLKDEFLNGVWSHTRRLMSSVADRSVQLIVGVFKAIFYRVPLGLWNLITGAASYIYTFNSIDDFEVNDNTDKVELVDNIDFINLKTLEDVSRMANVYKMARSIFCLEEEETNQISELHFLESDGKKSSITRWTIENSPMDCLSQGNLWNEKFKCGVLTDAIVGVRTKSKTAASSGSPSIFGKNITMNSFLEMGGVEPFANNTYFTNSDDKSLPKNAAVYKHMYMIKDATQEAVYKKISDKLNSKFPAEEFTRFTKYQNNGSIIDETLTGENGTIQMIKGKSYFVKSIIAKDRCHELWTLSYPNFEIISAGSQTYDHRILAYSNTPTHDLEPAGKVGCLDELEDTRYINFSFNYADFMTAINFTNSDSIKPTVKEFKVSQLDAYSRNEDIPKDPSDK